MNINDIKAALAVKASSLNISPITPDVQLPTEQKPQSPNTETITKSTAKKSVSKKATNKATATTHLTDIEKIIGTHLQAGIDYNTIPGCGKKPALLKAGAEHLAAIYGFRSTSTIINRIEDYQQGFVLYEVETTIVDVAGNIIATGLGSCNSKERRYQRSDFAGNLNTILKMAKKRSYVDAVLTACHASGVFTQDIEELSADNFLANNRKEA